MNKQRVRSLERRAQRGHKPQLRVLYERPNKTCFDDEGREFSSEQAARDYFAGDIVLVVDECMVGV